MSDDLKTPETAPETPAKPVRPNAWKAGRKPNPKGKRSQRKGTDQAGGELAIRADDKLAIPERDDPAYLKFAEIVGGKEGLMELAAWSENPKAQKLFELLDDGRYKTYGIKALAKRVGMTLPELCNLFREKHFLEMYLTFFSGVTAIAKGTVQDAQPGTDLCPMCRGTKTFTKDEHTLPCPKCKGTGEVRTPGDKEARRDVFKAIGIHKDAPAVVNNQIGNVTVEGVDDFESLMKSARSTPIIIQKIEKVEDVQEAEEVK